jgi:hypothetical protein
LIVIRVEEIEKSVDGILRIGQIAEDPWVELSNGLKPAQSVHHYNIMIGVEKLSEGLEIVGNDTADVLLIASLAEGGQQDASCLLMTKIVGLQAGCSLNGNSDDGFLIANGDKSAQCLPCLIPHLCEIEIVLVIDQ